MTEVPEAPAPPPEEPKSSVKGKKKKKKKASREAASFFRNAYRTQLDLTQLADNKASIMISVNGFILSVTLASGGVLLGSRSKILVPLLVLLLGCLGSMIYAILAARPRRARLYAPHHAGPSSRTGNVLFHETTQDLAEDDYAEEIDRILRDPDRPNEEMSRHLYSLGRVLVRKFRLLRISYTIFIVGLTATIVTFLAVAAGLAFPESPAEIVPEGLGESLRDATRTRFSRVYEPSGALALGDGSVLLVEDEEDRPFTLVSLGPDRRWRDETPLDPGVDLDDLEALAEGSEGRVYAIGSHARNDSGRSRPERERLARFTVADGAILDVRVLSDLAPRLAAAALDLPETEAEVRMRVLRPGLDVEGMAWDGSTGRLLVGLRSPLIDGRAVVLPLGNLDAAFDGSEPAEVGGRILLDLDGDGVRAMASDPSSGGYLLVGGPPGSPSRPFRLWHWDGPANTNVHPVTVPEPGLPARVEGIATLTVGDVEMVLFVVDDGSPKDGRPASYLLVARPELRIEQRQATETTLDGRGAAFDRVGATLSIVPPEPVSAGDEAAWSTGS